MSNSPRTRLDVAARREQLLAIGSELFAARPYDEVWIDDVAARAEVSRGLLYHYFESKRGFLHAVVERETQAILAATAVAPGVPAEAQLRRSIDGYLEYVAARPHGYRALFRGAVGADRRVREIVDANLERQCERILASIAPEEPTEAMRLAVHGWIASLIAMVLRWLDDPAVEREELAALATAMLAATLAAAR
ncbi:MAG: helix-turn-helix domain containing protein [Patulibacter minatonensis]